MPNVFEKVLRETVRVIDHGTSIVTGNPNPNHPTGVQAVAAAVNIARKS